MPRKYQINCWFTVTFLRSDDANYRPSARTIHAYQSARFQIIFTCDSHGDILHAPHKQCNLKNIFYFII